MFDGVSLLVGFVGGAVSAGWLLLCLMPINPDDSDDVEQFLDEEREALQQRYETTAMTYVEFGERITVLEDPGTERIIRDATDVDGIGPETALEIAATFGGDYEAYRTGSNEDLQAVNGIGPNRATALLHN